MKHMLSLIAFEISALLSLALVIYWIEQYAGGLKWENKNKAKFNYHPLFMIIAFVIIMGHSVITFRILPIAHRTKKYIHAVLNITAAIFATIGVVAVLQFHNEANIPNFYSLHSWLGLTTLSILYLQALAGFGIFQDLVSGANREIRAAYKPWHVVAGVCLIAFAACTITTGIQEKYGFVQPKKYSAHAYAYNFLGLSIFLWLATVIYILLAVEKREPEGYETLTGGAPVNTYNTE